jgi:hypothetical protein
VLKIEHYYLHECTYVHIKKYQKLGVYLDMFFFQMAKFRPIRSHCLHPFDKKGFNLPCN